MRTYTKYLGFAALTGFVVSGIAYAATQSVTVSSRFDSALTLTKDKDINFGTLKSLQVGTYVIDTVGVVTASGGGVIINGTPSFGKITITGSADQTVAIRVDNYHADNGVTPKNVTCEYDTVVVANCDTTGGAGLAPPTGTGKVLLLGLQIDVDGVLQTPNSVAAPTFDVNVIYG